ncbi:exonuclease domain-containing protein [Aurantiacibacter gangjinensis]|uniref:Uncharacterized protein n=1 Tax=Aurantiacibacter gangjinensis TaxID=502682 RepID=A0A0G9MR01_9SPHN|nr:exonuclease domain-containing protein [Aurantiacibacter gangjinensis]APE29035.1 DNA polymerase III epsilon subunit [Aurantiacibacter gangjinensis]KLE33132.1 hypothetical protein AAW01_03890 [Aurantiacibacter gangjinensis]
MLRGWLDRRRRARLAQHDDPALRAFAQADWPERSSPAKNAQFLALDFELDGLESDAHILQAGWISLDPHAIRLGTARRCDVFSDHQLSDKAVAVHGIGEGRARQGGDLKEVMSQMLKDCGGKIVVAHGAAIEKAALKRAASAIWNVDLPVRAICTMALEQRLQPNLSGDALRLGACRSRYHLPEFDAHDALNDAMATAELFLAQLSRLPADVRLASLEDARVGH